MTITAKPQNQKKNKTLKRLFGLASKDVFFVILVFFCFFVLKCKNPKKNLCFFVFFEGLWLEKNHQKPKNTSFFWFLHFKTKNTRITKKTSFEAKPKSLFKVLFFLFFLVLRFCGYCHSLHITSFQIYQDNKTGFILPMCVCYIYIYISLSLLSAFTKVFSVRCSSLELCWIFHSSQSTAKFHLVTAQVTFKVKNF